MTTTPFDGPATCPAAQRGGCYCTGQCYQRNRQWIEHPNSLSWQVPPKPWNQVPSPPVIPSIPAAPVKTMQMGWECPGCGRCYAPGMPSCTVCGKGRALAELAEAQEGVTQQ